MTNELHQIRTHTYAGWDPVNWNKALTTRRGTDSGQELIYWFHETEAHPLVGDWYCSTDIRKLWRYFFRSLLLAWMFLPWSDIPGSAHCKCAVRFCPDTNLRVLILIYFDNLWRVILFYPHFVVTEPTFWYSLRFMVPFQHHIYSPD